MTTEAEILFDVRGHAGLVTLNRPRALNALTHNMCSELDTQLKQWENDNNIHAVIIRGAGEKAFCAGGDIRAAYEGGKSGDPNIVDFYGDEYRCNGRIFHFTKPYIALIDGIIMGGGAGVSVHGSHQVATERTLFAMPETGIGLFPDVGGSHFLSRCPGELGMYLGLTGTRIKAADLIYSGLATHYMPSDKLEALTEALTTASHLNAKSVDAILAKFSHHPGAAPIARDQGRIDHFFGVDCVEQIVADLHVEGSEWAKKILDILLVKSPTSLKVTFRQLREGAAKNIDACLKMEYRMVNRFMAGTDFYEGVRAVLLDKDNSPIWQPDTLGGVSEQAVAAYFAPLEGGDLTLK